MKKSMKFFALLAALMLSLSILAGCGASEAASAAASTGSTPASADGGERVTITYAQWGNDTETAATQKVADKFNASQDHITVEIMQIDHESYITKLNTMARLPSGFLAQSWEVEVSGDMVVRQVTVAGTGAELAGA